MVSLNSDVRALQVVREVFGCEVHSEEPSAEYGPFYL